MAKLVARVDFYNPLWESKQMDDVFRKGSDDDKYLWMLAHCKCEHEEIDIDEIYDEILAEGDNFRITYLDSGLLEEIKVIEF